nr:hypothetical protein HK105_001720 [Polyrhizophydium stewartii]
MKRTDSRPTSGAESSGDQSDAGGGGERKKRPKTVLEAQRAQLERLMQRVDREIVLPKRPSDKPSQRRDPDAGPRNIQGSSAGAGSGDFHVYRAMRRKENNRLRELDEAARKEQEKREYEERMQAIRDKEAIKTNKNRLKRLKRKQGKTLENRGKKGSASKRQEGNVDGDGDEDEDEDHAGANNAGDDESVSDDGADHEHGPEHDPDLGTSGGEATSEDEDEKLIRDELDQLAKASDTGGGRSGSAFDEDEDGDLPEGPVLGADMLSATSYDAPISDLESVVTSRFDTESITASSAPSKASALTTQTNAEASVLGAASNSEEAQTLPSEELQSMHSWKDLIETVKQRDAEMSVRASDLESGMPQLIAETDAILSVMPTGTAGRLGKIPYSRSFMEERAEAYQSRCRLI